MPSKKIHLQSRKKTDEKYKGQIIQNIRGLGLAITESIDGSEIIWIPSFKTSGHQSQLNCEGAIGHVDRAQRVPSIE